MMTEVIQGDADRLALILGHNSLMSSCGTSRVLVGGPLSSRMPSHGPRNTQRTIREWSSRWRPASPACGLKALRRAMELGPRFVSFEALGHDHPSWEDRL